MNGAIGKGTKKKSKPLYRIQLKKNLTSLSIILFTKTNYLAQKSTSKSSVSFGSQTGPRCFLEIKTYIFWEVEQPQWQNYLLINLVRYSDRKLIANEPAVLPTNYG